jgi:AraC-like DNA-binding protein
LGQQVISVGGQVLSDPPDHGDLSSTEFRSFIDACQAVVSTSSTDNDRSRALLDLLAALPSANGRRRIAIESTLWQLFFAHCAQHLERDLVIPLDTIRLFTLGRVREGFLAMFFGLRTHRVEREAPGRSDLDARVAAAHAYIESHLDEADLSLEQVARHVNLSKWHFDRLLKQTTGASFRETAALIRVAKARVLLTTTSLQVKEIAARVGYRYAGEMTRHFRRYLGTSPTSFARASKAKSIAPVVPFARDARSSRNAG